MSKEKSEEPVLKANSKAEAERLCAATGKVVEWEEPLEESFVPEPPKDKKLIEYEFSDPEIKIGKKFRDPVSGEMVKIEKEQVYNAASGVVSTAEPYSKFAEANEDYHSGKYKRGEYLKWRWKVMAAWQKIQAIPNMALSASTSIELPSGHHVGVTVQYAGKQVAEPKPIDALVKLGVDGEDNFEFLGFIYSNQPNKKLGKRKSEEIMAIVNAYRTEMPALEHAKKQLREIIPTSITGLDSRIFTDLTSGIKTIENELKITLKAIVAEIDETLVRLARRGDYVPKDRSWVVRG
jgi:hypothetical protein